MDARDAVGDVGDVAIATGRELRRSTGSLKLRSNFRWVWTRVVATTQALALGDVTADGTVILEQGFGADGVVDDTDDVC